MVELNILHFFPAYLDIYVCVCFLLPSAEMNYMKDFYFYIILFNVKALWYSVWVVVTPPVSNVLFLHSWSQAQMKEEGSCR